MSDHEHHGHHHDHGHDHQDHQDHRGALGRFFGRFVHSHAAHERVDAAMETSERGIAALKISLVGLGLTAVFQTVIVVISGSVALLADTIHNYADASTSIILWVAFALGRRKPSRTMTYGYGRAEDLAGVAIVLIILGSAVVAGYESVHRLISPRLIEQPLWVGAAAIIGFVGNEAVAVYRIRVGREIGSAALVADGYHSRVDGFTSLAVLVSAIAAYLGWPVVDAIVGIGITVAILFIVRDAGQSVLRHIVDGVEPEIMDTVEHAIGHAPQVRRVASLKVRWVGHRLYIEADVMADGALSVREADVIARQVEQTMAHHVPALGHARVRVQPEPA
jgi:cation diffusion facilitator family transporter